MATMKNVKKLPKWQRGLTAAQRRHLRESMDGAVTLAGLRNNLAGQREDGCRCFECEEIRDRTFCGAHIQTRQRRVQ